MISAHSCEKTPSVMDISPFVDLQVWRNNHSTAHDNVQRAAGGSHRGRQHLAALGRSRTLLRHRGDPAQSRMLRGVSSPPDLHCIAMARLMQMSSRAPADLAKLHTWIILKFKQASCNRNSNQAYVGSHQ